MGLDVEIVKEFICALVVELALSHTSNENIRRIGGDTFSCKFCVQVALLIKGFAVKELSVGYQMIANLTITRSADLKTWRGRNDALSIYQ